MKTKEDLLQYWASFHDGGEPLKNCISFSGTTVEREGPRDSSCYKPFEDRENWKLLLNMHKFSNSFVHKPIEYELPEVCKKEGF